MAFFGLKLGLGLEMRAAHPPQKNPKEYPPPGSPTKRDLQTKKYKTHLQINEHSILTSGNVIDLLLGGLSTTFLRLAATGNKKKIQEMLNRSKSPRTKRKRWRPCEGDYARSRECVLPTTKSCPLIRPAETSSCATPSAVSR